mmetsp:Transcript_27625/g.44976  ORF Transcript_27625/g.44976 Transcript_27625/m.44976 type:complete len:88 (-) Transcript_27625:147-410(-)
MAQIVLGPKGDNGPYVFVELKHSKQKKGFVKMSTRCFAFYKPHEKSGDFELVFYEKPTEFTRDQEKLRSRKKIGKLLLNSKIGTPGM